MADKVIYTAIFGGKDQLHEVSRDFLEKESVKLVCFTDNKDLTSDTWEIRLETPTYIDPVRSAKVYKILPHKFFPEADYTLWVDGQMKLNLDSLDDLIDEYLIGTGKEIAFFSHPDRQCLYKEAEVCIEKELDEANLINDQIESYRRVGYPPNYRLIAGGFILRDNKSDSINKFNELWWHEISRFSRRDQVSANYVMWHLNINYSIFKQGYRDNDQYKLMKHNW